MARLLVTLALTLVLAGCAAEEAPSEPDASPEPTAESPGAGDEEPSGTGQAQVADELATGLTSPWGLVVLDDGSLLISERDTQQIKHLQEGEQPRVVATIDDAQPAGEAGLLGLAVTPDQDTVLAYYTSAEDNRIVAMRWDGNRLGEPDVIYEGIPHGDGDRHEGGVLTVGPDDLLYVGTGETGVAPELSQQRDNPAGKILRLTLDGEPADDNPFDTEIYSWGHRNVQGLAFDDDGRLWASEFGADEWDELNLIEPGANYGWPEVEGPGGGDEYVDPVEVWRPAAASPSGLAFWDGSLWMAALRGETLWEIPLGARGRTQEPVPHFEGQYGRLRSVTVAPGGDGLLVATSNTDGRGEVRDGDDRLLLVTR